MERERKGEKGLSSLEDKYGCSWKREIKMSEKNALKKLYSLSKECKSVPRQPSGSPEIPGRPARQVAGYLQFYLNRSTPQVVSAVNPARLPDIVNTP
jgi:hypothetical protein